MQGPLVTHRRPAASQKLPEAPRVFDLAEDRLDDRLPSRVHRAPDQRPELPGHPLATGQARGRAPARRGREPLAMRLPAGRDVGVDPSSLQRVQVRPRSSSPHPPAPAVGRCCRVRPIAVTCGSNCPTSAAIGRHVLRHDHLRVRIHRRLRVVALDEPVGGLLDLRLRIGEVPLGLRGRRGLGRILPALRGLLPRLGFQRGLRLADLLQAALPAGQLRGQLIAAPVRPRTGRPRPGPPARPGAAARRSPPAGPPPARSSARSSSPCAWRRSP